MPKTIKKRIHHYISRKQDICCEDDIDRPVVIQQLIDKYKSISKEMADPDDYLSYMDNDLVKMIGYKVDLMKDKNKEGVQLWNSLNKRVVENKIVIEKKMIAVLQEVPLYFRMSFLGYASYRLDMMNHDGLHHSNS
jgi:hypothetical protein